MTLSNLIGQKMTEDEIASLKTAKDLVAYVYGLSSSSSIGQSDQQRLYEVIKILSHYTGEETACTRGLTTIPAEEYDNLHEKMNHYAQLQEDFAQLEYRNEALLKTIERLVK